MQQEVHHVQKTVNHLASVVERWEEAGLDDEGVRKLSKVPQQHRLCRMTFTGSDIFLFLLIAAAFVGSLWLGGAERADECNCDVRIREILAEELQKAQAAGSTSPLQPLWAAVVAANSTAEQALAASPAGLGDRIDTVNETAQELRAGLSSLNGSLTVLEAGAGVTNSSLVAVEAEVAALNSALDAVNSSVVALEAGTGAVNSSLVEVEDEVGALKLALDAVNGTAAANAAVVGVLDGTVTGGEPVALRTELSAVNTTLSGGVAGAESAAADLAAVVDGLNTSVEELRNASASATNLTALMDLFVGKGEADSVAAAMLQAGAVGTTAINSSEVQRRVSSTCPAGQFAVGMTEDGTLSCSQAFADYEIVEELYAGGGVIETACPAGKLVVGGGCQRWDHDLTDTYPISTTRWRCEGASTGAVVNLTSGFAICATLPT